MARTPAPEAGATPKPKKRRWYHQVWDVFQMTRKADPVVPWLMLAIVVGVSVAGYLIGLAFDRPGYALFLAVPFGVLGAVLLLGRRAERAAYGQIEGQPGATSAALGTIRRGWSLEEQPVAVDPRTQAMVFRAVGKPGVVLIAEGGTPAIRQRLLAGERKRVVRLIPDAPVHLLECGREEGQVPLQKIAATVKKQKGAKLTSSEVAEISKRLRSIGQLKLPLPKGVDPMRARPDRKGMRGR